MKRRILAWVLLAGFVLLLLNIMFIKFYWQLSMVLYLLIAFAFLLYNSKATRAKAAEELRNRMDGGDDDNGNSDEADNDIKSAENNVVTESNDE